MLQQVREFTSSTILLKNCVHIEVSLTKSLYCSQNSSIFSLYSRFLPNHYAAGWIIIFEMNLTEEIAAVKSKIDDLEQQLTLSSQLLDQKELVIRQQIVAKENQLTELYKLQNALAGETVIFLKSFYQITLLFSKFFYFLS